MLIQFHQDLSIYAKDDVRQLGNGLCVIKSAGVITDAGLSSWLMSQSYSDRSKPK